MRESKSISYGAMLHMLFAIVMIMDAKLGNEITKGYFGHSAPNPRFVLSAGSSAIYFIQSLASQQALQRLYSTGSGMDMMTIAEIKSFLCCV